MPLIKAKIGGSSIIESIIALFIITLSFSISVIVIANVLKSQDRVLREKVALGIDNIIQEQKIELKKIEPITKGRYIIECNTKKSDLYPGVVVITVTASYINGKVIAERCIYIRDRSNLDKEV